MQISATLTQDQSLDAARDAVYKALEDVVKEPAYARGSGASHDASCARGLENSLSNAQAIATGALNTAIAQGDWRLMFLQHDRLQDITSGRSRARGADVFQAVQPHGRLLHA